MTSQSWILTGIGIFVSSPILWVIYRAFRGMRGAEANVWSALPPKAQSGFQLVFALPQPLENKPPKTADDFSAISVTVPGQRAGLMLDPGRYWLYAVAAPGPMADAQALDAAAIAVRDNPSAVIPFENLPLVVA